MASPFAAPSNYDIKKHASDMQSKLSVKVVSQQTISQLKEFKVGQLQKSKLLIETVHARLKESRELTELVNLESLERHLPARLRSLFTGMPLHQKCLRDLTILN
jgi:hypothetical protein